MSEIWTEKYSPKDLSEFIGNDEISRRVQAWADAWASGQPQKPLLLHGSPGVGKTCLAILTAKLYDWELFEMNASDFRTKDIIDKVAGAASQGATFSGKKRLILLDEVDGLQSQDRGGAGSIITILKESKNPIILTANEIYADQKLAPMRTYAEPLEFKKINYLSIAKRLREILDTELMTYDPEAIKEFAKNTGGDFRAALLDLQTLSMNQKEITMADVQSLGYRERKENIFKIMKSIFKGKDLKEIRQNTFQSSVSGDLLSAWVEENIPRQYTNNEDAARAFAALSRADIFNGRIYKRQYWGYKRYSSDLMSSGVAFAKENEYYDFVMYTFPTLLRQLSGSRALRAMKKELGTKIGKKIHTSSREVMAYDLPYLQMFFENKELAAQYTAQFELNEKELAFLMNTKPTTKKVKKILEEAEEIRLKNFTKRRKALSGISEKQLAKGKSPAAVSERSLQNFEPEETETAETEAEENEIEEEAHKQTKLF
ncbi:MAG: replication factor C large subunit [Candidatus Diapherotrites archaeon]